VTKRHPVIECDTLTSAIELCCQPEHIRQLHDGVELDDGPARFQRCWFDGGSDNNQWYRVVLSEGRNREVRRLWMALGYQVSRLIRVRYGPVELPGYVRAGKFIDVDEGVH